VVTLHIEHAITDFDTWKQAFDRFADMRRSSGVARHRIQRPADDDRYVLIDLDFSKADDASSFLDFLTTTVWSTPTNAPALVGVPQTRVLNLIEEGPSSI
jgi:hypothetical protein